MPAAAQAEHPARAHRSRREVSAAQEGRLAALLAGLLLALGAAALDEPQWPPPEAQAARMRELQQAISARDATAEQREVARRELARMLRSPGAGPESSPPAKAPARAAIQPLPPIEPREIKSPPRVDPAGVARLEVVEPSRAAVNPSTGSVVAPTGAIFFDLRSGSVMQETPSGYFDPRTGQLIPK